jgi:hypothetical protein
LAFLGVPDAFVEKRPIGMLDLDALCMQQCGQLRYSAGIPARWQNVLFQVSLSSFFDRFSPVVVEVSKQFEAMPG